MPVVTMKPHLSAQKIDQFGLVARWALMPLLALLFYGDMSLPLLGAVLALYAVAGVLVRRSLHDVTTYQRRGQRLARGLRLADTVSIGALCLLTGEGRSLAIGVIPFILLDGYCSRDVKRSSLLGVTMIAVAAVGAGMAKDLSAMIVPIGAIIG
ncbi:MAG: hypothetical protein C4320_03560, partial [Armatimonadota bacterium]